MGKKILKGKISVEKIRERGLAEVRKLLKENKFRVRWFTGGTVFSSYQFSMDVAGKKVAFSLQLYRSVGGGYNPRLVYNNPYDSHNKWRWEADFSILNPEQYEKK